MIKNARQYLSTKTEAGTFRETIATAAASPPADKAGRERWQWTLEGLRSQLGTLEEEIRLYEDMQHVKGKRQFAVSIEHLAALLIQARTARGWSQRELAVKLGLQMQKVQQYEATDYAGASLTVLLEVCQALGLTGRIDATLVDLPDAGTLPRVVAPKGDALRRAIARSLDAVRAGGGDRLPHRRKVG